MKRSSLNHAPSRFARGVSSGSRCRAAALLALGAVCLATSPAHAVTIDWVTVGNAGNANDTTGYGAVGYEYQIGKYEVTIQQYTDFLNAVAKNDPYELWHAWMGINSFTSGISRAGAPGSYVYSVMTASGSAPYGGVSNGNRPISFVQWWDAARFANWMQNGQGSGSTETGAYTLNGATSGTAPAKNAGAQFYIPTENEWYKAAYYSPLLNGGAGGYRQFATEEFPGNTIGSGSNQANYRALGLVEGTYQQLYSVTQSASTSSGQNYLTDVGAFTNSASYYGTFDQGGNVEEWNDLDGSASTSRGFRGGTWASTSYELSRNGRDQNDASFNLGGSRGFRLASPIAAVPEPSTWVLAAGGLACAGWEALRRRKRA